MFLSKEKRFYSEPGQQILHDLTLPPMDQTNVNGEYGCLRTFKIAPGPQTQDTLAIRAPIPLQPERLIIAVKISLDKAVSLDPALTAGTVTWLVPGIAPFQPKKFLERYIDLE